MIKHVLLLILFSQTISLISCSCITDANCTSNEYCSYIGECSSKPLKLGEACRSDEQCINYVDVWSKCINSTCLCAEPYVERHGSCFCDGTLPGATVSLLMLLYTLLPVGILIAIVVAIVCTLRSRSSPPVSPIESQAFASASQMSVSYRRRSTRTVTASTVKSLDRH
jgi:hypothetical protein